ncbi:hypothetical protein BDQ17DRAFT_1322705 [Cyathus striatus]|nr:hypothetical protein BDQ17DRAFT_1322705 [Cyathus striatus]
MCPPETPLRSSGRHCSPNSHSRPALPFKTHPQSTQALSTTPAAVHQRHVKQPSKNPGRNSQVVRAQVQPLTPPAEVEKKHAQSGVAPQQPRGRAAKQSAAAKDKAAKRYCDLRPFLAKAIPVPRPSHANNRQNRASNELSRSDPVRSTMPNRKPRIFKRADTADRSIDRPSLWRFPFNVQHSPSPAPMQQRATIGVAAGRRYHKRVPSDGLFNMSSDEDSGISSGTGSKLSPGVQALFGLLPSTPAHTRTTPPPMNRAEFSYPSPFSTPVQTRAVPATYPRHGAGPGMTAAEREAEFEREAEREVKGYFASSLFQNSPSPEELPDPIFV